MANKRNVQFTLPWFVLLCHMILILAQSDSSIYSGEKASYPLRELGDTARGAMGFQQPYPGKLPAIFALALLI